jgi:hypothetical protein
LYTLEYLFPIGDVDLAAAHGRAAVARHKNQHRLLHARAALALSIANGGHSAKQTKTKVKKSSKLEADSESNGVLEQLHWRFLSHLNEGNLDGFKAMITDDITSTDPMNKTRTGREWVERAMAKGIQMFKGNFTMEDGRLQCELKTLGTDETGARYTVSMMGMKVQIGDRIKWQDGCAEVIQSRMNPPEGF